MLALNVVFRVGFNGMGCGVYLFIFAVSFSYHTFHGRVLSFSIEIDLLQA